MKPTLYDDKAPKDHGGLAKESTIIRLDDCDSLASISADDEAISDSLRALVMETECILEAIVRLNSTTQPNRDFSQLFVPDKYDDVSIGEVICLDNYDFKGSYAHPERSQRSPTKSTESISSSIKTSSWYLKDVVDEDSDRSLWLSSQSHLTAETDETVCFGVREVFCPQQQQCCKNPKTLASGSHSLSTVTAEETIYFDEEKTHCRRDKAFGRARTPFTASKSFSTAKTEDTTYSDVKDIICLYEYDDDFIYDESGRNSENFKTQNAIRPTAQTFTWMHDEKIINTTEIEGSLSHTPWNAAKLAPQRLGVRKDSYFHEYNDRTTRQATASGSQISGLTEEPACFDVDEVIFGHNEVFQGNLKNMTSLSISTVTTDKSALSHSCNASNQLIKSTQNSSFKSEKSVHPQCNPEINKVSVCTGEMVSRSPKEIHVATSRDINFSTQSLSTTETEICLNNEDPLITKHKDTVLPFSQTLSTSATEDSVCSSTGTINQSTSYDASFNTNTSKPIMSSTRYLKLATERRKQSSRRIPLTRSVSSGTGSAFTEKALDRLSGRGRIPYRQDRSTTSDPNTKTDAKRGTLSCTKPPKTNLGKYKKSNDNAAKVAPRTAKSSGKFLPTEVSGRKQSRTLKQQEAVLQRLCRPTAAWKSRCAS